MSRVISPKERVARKLGKHDALHRQVKNQILTDFDKMTASQMRKAEARLRKMEERTRQLINEYRHIEETDQTTHYDTEPEEGDGVKRRKRKGRGMGDSSVLPKEVREAFELKSRLDTLGPGAFENYTKDVNDPRWFGNSLGELTAGQMAWPNYQKEMREQGLDPTEDGYRLQRLEKWIQAQELDAQTRKNMEGHNTIGGFFKGAWDSFTQVAPQALADVANVVGRVLPGSSLITDKLEEALNPEGKKHSWEELGGPWENVINGAVGAAGKLTAGGLAMRHKRPRRKASMYSVKKYI